MGAAVTARQLSKSFDGPSGKKIEALCDLTFVVETGEFVSILGPSGCGKSTLLRLIANLDTASSGELNVSRQAVDEIGYVFQEAHLLPWRTVLSNVCLPLELLGKNEDEQRSSALHALEQVGLDDFAEAYPSQLSGGMRMRVSLARALVTQPKLLLLDEPFAALDQLTRQKLDEDLRKLWIKNSLTILFVTHSIEEACFLSNRAFVFSRRPASLILDTKIELPQIRSQDVRLSQSFVEQEQKLFKTLDEASR